MSRDRDVKVERRKLFLKYQEIKDLNDETIKTALLIKWVQSLDNHMNTYCDFYRTPEFTACPLPKA